MSFKTKIKKNAPCDMRVTLDAKNKEKINHFDDLDKSLDKI